MQISKYPKPAPCMNCADRCVKDGKTCHATCATFAEWKAKSDHANKKYRESIYGESMVNSLLAKGAMKTLRKNRRAKGHFLFKKGGRVRMTEQYGIYYAEEGPAEGFIGTVHEMIAKQPIIEAEPVRRGRWEWEKGYVGTMAVCSVCGKSPRGFYSLPKNQIGRLPVYRFCPNCGADMREMNVPDICVGNMGGTDNVELKPCPFCGGARMNGDVDNGNT